VAGITDDIIQLRVSNGVKIDIAAVPSPDSRRKSELPGAASGRAPREWEPNRAQGTEMEAADPRVVALTSFMSSPEGRSTWDSI